MRARLVVSVLVVMALVYAALIGWSYLLRRANAQLRAAVPGMVEDALRASVGASEVGRRSSTYQLGKSRHVTIENPSGNIEVIAGGSQVMVESVIHAIGSSYAAAAAKAPSIRVVESRASDGGLTIAVVRDERVRNVWMHLKVRVPLDVHLRVTSTSGDVQVAGLRGPVTVHVGSGDITADGARGRLSAKSGSGDLRLSAISGETVAHTDSGDVSASINTSRRVVAGSGSGNVTMKLLQPFSGTLEVRADSGNVMVSLPAGSDCRVRAATASGNVTSTLPLVEASRTESEISGRLGAGRGSVTAESASGNVELRENGRQ